MKNASLIKAIKEKDLNFIKSLTNTEIDEVLDNQGKTALMLAVNGSHIENIKVLLDAGANPNHKTQEGLPSIILWAEKQMSNCGGLISK